MISHVFDCFSSVSGMWCVVSLNLISQGPEQAISGHSKGKFVCTEVRNLWNTVPWQITRLIWLDFLHEEAKWVFMQNHSCMCYPWKSNLFSYERFHMKTHFETEAQSKLNPLVPKGSHLWWVKSSGIRQSKIYKSLLGIEGLKGDWWYYGNGQSAT